MMNPGQYGKMMLLLAIGALLIWIGLSGRPGSLLGALITPDYMAAGTPPAPQGAGSAPGGSAPQSGGPFNSGSTLSDLQIATFAYNAGVTSFSALSIAVAICLAESGGLVGNTNPKGSLSGALGLWQILHSAHPQYNVQQLVSDPAYNAQAMAAISGNGSSWCPWQSYSGAGCNGTGYRNTYAQFLSRGQTAAQQVIVAAQLRGTI